LLDGATKYVARVLVEVATSIDSSLLAPGGSAGAAGDLLAQRLTKAGALEAIAVMLLLGWRMTTGGRIGRTAWSLLVVLACLASALRDAVPAACVAAVLATPAFRLRFPVRERQPRPLRCLPHGEHALLAATALALVGIGVALTQSTSTTRSPRVAFPDAVATLPGATLGAADPREVALAGANARWQHWTLPARSADAPSSASLTVDYVTSSNGFDGDTLAAALRAGGYRLLSTKHVPIGSAPATLRSFTGTAGDGMTSISWTPDGVPGHLAVVISYEPDGVTDADAAAATSVAARLAAASAAS
jgi:hypothetical protein